MIVISGIEDITGGQGYFYLVSPTNRNIQRATQMKQVSPRCTVLITVYTVLTGNKLPLRIKHIVFSLPCQRIPHTERRRKT